MVTLSFEVDPIKVPEICSALIRYGIKEIKSKEKLPNYVLEDVKLSLQESDRREIIDSYEVHKRIEEYVQDSLYK